MSSIKEETKEGHHVTTITFESTDKSEAPVELTTENYAKLLAENEALKAEINELHNKNLNLPAAAPLGGLLNKVNHYSRIVNDAEVSKNFYVNILGCTLLNRPNLPKPGYWIWMGNIQLHLIEHPHDKTQGLIGTQGFVNHLSFETDDIKQVEIRLKENNIDFVRNVIPEGEYRILQLFFPDPDGYYCEVCTCAEMSDFVFGEPISKEDNRFSNYNDNIELVGDALALIAGLDWAQDKKCNKDEFNTLLVQLKKAYNLAASDSNAKITRKDLLALFAKMGHPVDEQLLVEKLEECNLTCEESEEMPFEKVLKILVAIVLERKEAPSITAIEQAFHQLDKDGTGSITKDEMMATVLGLGLIVDDDILEETISKLDMSHDGKISITEFSQHISDIFKQLDTST